MKSACEVIKKDKAPGSKAIGFFGSGWFWGSLGNYQVVLDFSSLFSGGWCEFLIYSLDELELHPAPRRPSRKIAFHEWFDMIWNHRKADCESLELPTNFGSMLAWDLNLNSEPPCRWCFITFIPVEPLSVWHASSHPWIILQGKYRLHPILIVSICPDATRQPWSMARWMSLQVHEHAPLGGKRFFYWQKDVCVM